MLHVTGRHVSGMVINFYKLNFYKGTGLPEEFSTSAEYLEGAANLSYSLSTEKVDINTKKSIDNGTYRKKKTRKAWV